MFLLHGLKDLETDKSFYIFKEFPLMCIIVSGGHTDLVKLDSDLISN